MMSLRSLIVAFLLFVVVANAFTAPAALNRPATTTALKFGFLKELGLEKPDWLPDFGGKKEEEPAPTEDMTEEGEEAEAAAAED